MRTTIRLSDEAFRVAESMARQRRITLGEAVSELILRPARAAPVESNRRGGLPVFDCDRPVTADDVQSLDE
jgi:hypothetical protein